MKINWTHPDATGLDKGWQRGAFAFWLLNLVVISVAQNMVNQALDACGRSDHTCYDAAISAGDASNRWMAVALISGFLAFALNPVQRFRTARFVLLGVECAAMALQLAVSP